MEPWRATITTDNNSDEEERLRRATFPWRRAAARTATTDGVLPGRLGHAQRGRHLLQEDDAGDPDGEPLDHRPRDVGEEAAESQNDAARMTSTPAIIPNRYTAPGP